ncbi:MAG TPA: c-type cytochrome [Fibrobacteria bacterium]|nr:c-type cytochrome [Fibrobacteria bacterium]
MEPKDALLESHQDNDGIREYDNPLPDWFVHLFYGCIAFAFLYVGYFTGKGWALSRAGGVGQNLSWSGAEYLAAVRREAGAAATARPGEMTGEALVAYLRAPGTASGGESVFKSNCLACHGEQGQGVVGPNLTDPFWLHGGTPEAVLASITHGYPDKGMPAWKPVLGAEKVRLAAAYVLSLKGRTVANPKAPQGVRDP